MVSAVIYIVSKTAVKTVWWVNTYIQHSNYHQNRNSILEVSMVNGHIGAKIVKEAAWSRRGINVYVFTDPYTERSIKSAQKRKCLVPNIGTSLTCLLPSFYWLVVTFKQIQQNAQLNTIGTTNGNLLTNRWWSLLIKCAVENIFVSYINISSDKN